MTRLIRQFRDRGRIRDRRGSPAKPFTRRYSEADIVVLAQKDALHGTLSGPATHKLCQRAFHLYHDPCYERLATLSNGHRYNLRQRRTYPQQRRTINKTRSTRIPIGERWAPDPQGRPGFLRVDTVHQD